MLEQEIKVEKEILEQEITLEKEELGFVPSGTKEIVENGVYEISQYENVDVDVPGIIPSGTKTITSNGEHNVYDYEKANVQVPLPSGQVDITSNGIHNVNDYETANVNVPGIIPAGKKTITANGTHNVYDYAEAEVNVPEPSGSISITTNGEHNVKDYATANVSVPGIVPSGTKSITTNGTHDVTSYASAEVNVPAGISNISDFAYMFTYGHRFGQAQQYINSANNVTACDNMFSYVAVEEPIQGTINLTNFDTSNVQDFSYMFQECEYLDPDDINNFYNLNTQNATNFSNMFNGFFVYGHGVQINYNRTLDFTNYNTSKVTDMSYMFANCSYHINRGTSNKIVLDLSNWDTSKVEDMRYMFSYNRFDEYKFTNWDTSKVKDMRYMFQLNAVVEEYDLSSFTSDGEPNCQGMFSAGHNKLIKIDLRNFDFSKVTNSNSMFGTNSQGVKNTCLIIVKDATQKQWLATNFSRLTNVQTVEEYES